MSSAPESSGYVYILLNPAFTHFVKIGKTTKEPHLRARELSTGTGVPAPYQVAWEVKVTDCHAAERKVHDELDRFRARENREFFSLPLRDAIALVAKLTAPFAFDPAMETLSTTLPPAKSSAEVAASPAKDESTNLRSVRMEGPRRNPSSEGIELPWDAVSVDVLAGEAPDEIRGSVAHVLDLVRQVGVEPTARQRGDGAWVFVPPAKANAGTGRNLLTLWVTKNRVRIRIMPAPDETFAPSRVAEYVGRMKSLLNTG
jgi:hypothetical protein